MKTIVEQMISYSSYHRDPRNKATHFIGVPLVIYSILIPMGWFRFAPVDIPLSIAMLFILFVFLYYLKLDKVLALAQLPFTVALLYAADRASLLPFLESAQVFAASFVGGWIFQLTGHVFEGRRPALVDNIWQVFNAPLFLTLELLFILGIRRDMQKKVDAECQKIRQGVKSTAVKLA
jgi:uncharacterized membrane protein YGL010W